MTGVSVFLRLLRVFSRGGRFPAPYRSGLVFSDASIPSALEERWPRLFGQHVPVLKWRLAVFCLRGGAPCRQVVKVHSIRRVAVKRPMRPGRGVERQVAR